MDSASPPNIVFESVEACSDRDRAEEVFHQALGSARSPGSGWVIVLRIGAVSPPAVTAEAEVLDAAGTLRAHTVLAGDAADCSAVARGASEWASAVMQTEAQPPPAAAGADQPTAPEAQPSQVAPRPPPATIAPAPNTRPEASAFVARPEYEMPALELGIGTFFMVGAAAGGYAGISPFLVDEVAEGVFLRPSLGVGTSLGAGPNSTWLAARLDTCVRLPGRYASRNGIQLDLCGGADGGFSYVASGTQSGAPPTSVTLPYVDLGPSLSLRGEVGNLAISLRGVAGIDVAHAGFVDVTGAKVDAPLLSWRLEVDFAWALQRSR